MESIKNLVEKLNDTDDDSVKENIETDIQHLLFEFVTGKCESLSIWEKTPERLENYLTSVSDYMYEEVIAGNYDYDKIFTNSLYCRNCYEKCPEYSVMDWSVYCTKCYIAHFDFLVDNVQNMKAGQDQKDASRKLRDFLLNHVQSQCVKYKIADKDDYVDHVVDVMFYKIEETESSVSLHKLFLDSIYCQDCNNYCCFPMRVIRGCAMCAKCYEKVVVIE